MSETHTFQYFAEEYCRFRELMGNRKYMVEQPEKLCAALGGLITVYFNVEPSEKDGQLKTMMAALVMELQMRQQLMAGLEIRDLLERLNSVDPD